MLLTILQYILSVPDTCLKTFCCIFCAINFRAVSVLTNWHSINNHFLCAIPETPLPLQEYPECKWKEQIYFVNTSSSSVALRGALWVCTARSRVLMNCVTKPCLWNPAPLLLKTSVIDTHLISRRPIAPAGPAPNNNNNNIVVENQCHRYTFDQQPSDCSCWTCSQ